MKRRPQRPVRKCFLTGSNSSCRNHIRSYHYDEYKARCEAAKPPIMLNQRCIPADVSLAEGKEKRARADQSVQQKLGFSMVVKPVEYTREGVLDVVVSHVACDSQVSLISRVVVDPVLMAIHLGADSC